jgi:hypothetical protein
MKQIIMALAVIATAIAIVGGYIHNIYDLIAMAKAGGDVGIMFVARIIGMFFSPLGVALGLLT